MATGDLIEIAVWDEDGNPKTDALVGFTDYRNRSGTSRSFPSFEHVGQGVYRAKPTTSDVAEGIAWVVETDGFPRFYSGAVCPEAAPFAAFLLTDQVTGALWAGAAPTLTGVGALYDDADGNARTPPALAAVHAPYLYAVTPSAADLAVGILGKLSMPSGADPSPAPPFSFFVPTAVDPAVASSQAPSNLFPHTIRYAEISARTLAAVPTTGPVSTSIGRVQPTRQFVRDTAGQSTQARFIVYLPPTATVTAQHRVWLPGDALDQPGRRILAIDKLHDVSSERFRKVYV